MFIRNTIQKTVDNCYTFASHSVPYPDKLISEIDFPGLKSPTGAVDIPEIIAEFLLSIDFEDLIIKPHIMMSTTGQRVISSYVTGTDFEKICAVINDKFGPDVYPIILQFNADGMPVEGLGKYISLHSLCFSNLA